MATYYELPGGLNWVKQNIHTIIGNKPLEEIMAFGDTWRARGHVPLVHVISPAMDSGKMWDQHIDPSGLLDNIASHIDMFIVDFHNRYEPEVPHIWKSTKSPPTWLLWEYKAGYVKFNGTQDEFVRKFQLDPTDLSSDSDGTTTSPGGNGTTTPTTGNDVTIHIVCPHCGKRIF
jgi:hypothetical protein